MVYTVLDCLNAEACVQILTRAWTLLCIIQYILICTVL